MQNNDDKIKETVDRLAKIDDKEAGEFDNLPDGAETIGKLKRENRELKETLRNIRDMIDAVLYSVL